ncbi:hypothetical protein [Streptomyces sp. ID05-47C]|uniref:hypothetical protein n=1 Tax=Streptomyces sp. ID05-47C TaxID=3028665 RepID=UPI0029B27A45|nr:hypothetical protein [Streptomyces sp. ID05-47C]MDX3569246.1 hypothetical protein [Streptomyces sp. ID05-47C]
MKLLPGRAAALAGWAVVWATVTLGWWLVGRLTGDRPSILMCAFAAVFSIVGGELADRRRRRRARNRAAKRRASTGGSSTG